MRTISLDQLTVLGVSPPEVVSIATGLGCEAVGLMAMGTSFFPTPPDHALEKNNAVTRELAARLRDTGVAIHNVDLFLLQADTKVAAFRSLLELCAELGARNAVAVVWDEDSNRSRDTFSALAELTRSLGLGLLLEFAPISTIKSLGDAVALLEQSAQPNTRLLVDILHLMQAGNTPADVAALNPALIGSAQICDGPLNPSFEQYVHNLLYERQIPGEGELPLADFLAALPPDIVLGVEVPLKSLAAKGIPPLERARRCVDATRRLLNQAESP